MERLHIIALFNFVVMCNLQYSTATVCVSSCVGKINGNYQYCPDCRKYVACSNGYRYIMPCAANLVWDDSMKRCEWTSSTCPGSTTARTTISVCVSSCVGKINGNYQYCPDCRKYVACSNGYRYIMPCAANLVWDDNIKRCEWTSSTCPGSTTARTTISELPTGTHTIRSTRPRTIYTTTTTPRTTTPRTTTPRTTTFTTTTASTTCGTDKCSTLPTTTTPTSTTETTTPGSTTTTTSTSTIETTTPGSTTTTTPTSTIETTTPGSTTTTTSTSTTETTTPGSTTTTTPTSTTATTTPVTTTPNECHITPPTDCCIRKKMWISLEDDGPVVLGQVPFVNIMEQTTGKCGCDAKILLNVTFQRHEHGDPCQGCTNVPECGNKMLRIDLEMAPRTTGVSFHVGDSRTNNGYKGDASTQEKDAEFLSLGYEHLLYGSDQCPNMSMIMTGLLSNSVTSVTIFIGNEFIRVSNNHGYVYELCSECLFSLNGQSDSQGPVNEDIFIGLNRIIDSSSYRDGTGVCSAVISWACPWGCLT